MSLKFIKRIDLKGSPPLKKKDTNTLLQNTNAFS